MTSQPRQAVADNAGGGRRGLRATPSPDLFELLGDQYGLACAGEAVDLGGSSNLNLLLPTSRGRWVVRVYRPHVTPARLNDICRVTLALAAQGVPCALPQATRAGVLWVAWGQRLLTVEPYIPHDGRMNCWPRLTQGLPLLGQMHTIMAGLPASAEGKRPLFANYIAPQEALPATKRGVGRIRGWGPTPAEARLADQAETLAERVWAAERELVAALPKQLVQGDFWDNNVLFCGERVVLVTDLDFMGERPRVDDLALTLYFYCLEEPHKPASAVQLERLRLLVDAYDGALATRLSPLERRSLPLAIARQPLWSIGGWVAQLDDAFAARRHANACAGEVDWVLGLLNDRVRWEAAFAHA